MANFSLSKCSVFVCMDMNDDKRPYLVRVTGNQGPSKYPN